MKVYGQEKCQPLIQYSSTVRQLKKKNHLRNKKQKKSPHVGVHTHHRTVNICCHWVRYLIVVPYSTLVNTRCSKRCTAFNALGTLPHMSKADGTRRITGVVRSTYAQSPMVRGWRRQTSVPQSAVTNSRATRVHSFSSSRRSWISCTVQADHLFCAEATN